MNNKKKNNIVNNNTNNNNKNIKHLGFENIFPEDSRSLLQE